LSEGAGKVTWAAVALALIGFGTAAVTSWDKLFPTGTTASKLTTGTNYLNWRWQTYVSPAQTSAEYVKKWNNDCVAEGQRQLLSHNFSIYNIYDSGVGGGAQFQNTQELLIVITCRAMDRHLEYSAVAVGPSTEAASVDRNLAAIMDGMARPGMSFGQ
jgi:hypothetical protein